MARKLLQNWDAALARNRLRTKSTARHAGSLEPVTARFGTAKAGRARARRGDVAPFRKIKGLPEGALVSGLLRLERRRNALLYSRALHIHFDHDQSEGERIIALAVSNAF
jgi:hypothetical protein